VEHLSDAVYGEISADRQQEVGSCGALCARNVLFDVVRLATANPFWGEMSYWLIVVGLIGGLMAAVFGLIDWLGVPRRTRAWRIGLLHGTGNVIVVALFALSLWLRWDVAGAPPMMASVLAFVGIGLALVTGWLGGELVERLGVGVDDGANLNAPSSLTSEPPGHSTTGEARLTPHTAAR
jgi:uncharacterized membrane protein